MRARFERMLSFDHPGLCGFQGRIGTVQLLLTLVHYFFGLAALLHKVSGAIHFLLCEQNLTGLLGDVGVGFLDGFLRQPHLGFGFLQRGRKVLGVHTCDDLAGFDHVTFVGKHFGDAPGELSVDVDLIRFDPAVAPGDPRRQ